MESKGSEGATVESKGAEGATVESKGAEGEGATVESKGAEGGFNPENNPANASGLSTGVSIPPFIFHCFNVLTCFLFLFLFFRCLCLIVLIFYILQYYLLCKYMINPVAPKITNI